MKNIHILPTDKPSRLYLGNNGNFVFGMIQTSIQSRNDDFTNQNIYITNDEEIKEGDYVLYREDKISRVLGINIDELKLNKGGVWRSSCKKIILTTDQDLIADGVQAIDDEFLEWFVKNPSCEEIGVKKYENNKYWTYEIIIPKEEPKQSTKDRIMSETSEETKQKARDYANFLVNHKQETHLDIKDNKIELLEEDLECIRMYLDDLKIPRNDKDGNKYSIIGRIKWQQEKRYSEEEVKKIIKLSCEEGMLIQRTINDKVKIPYTRIKDFIINIIEQFKKK